MAHETLRDRARAMAQMRAIWPCEIFDTTPAGPPRRFLTAAEKFSVEISHVKLEATMCSFSHKKFLDHVSANAVIEASALAHFSSLIPPKPVIRF